MVEQVIGPKVFTSTLIPICLTLSMPPFSVPLERWCFPGRTCVTKLEPSGGGPQQRDEFLLLCERVASVECHHQEGAFRFHEVRLRRSVVHLGVHREHRALADAEDLRCPWPTLSDLHEDSLLDVLSAQAPARIATSP